jgi:hypothetical protein
MNLLFGDELNVRAQNEIVGGWLRTRSREQHGIELYGRPGHTRGVSKQGRNKGKCGDCSMREHRSNTHNWSLSHSRAHGVGVQEVTTDNTPRFTMPNSAARCKARPCQWGKVAAPEAATSDTRLFTEVCDPHVESRRSAYCKFISRVATSTQASIVQA